MLVPPSHYLRVEWILPSLKASSKEEAIEEISSGILPYLPDLSLDYIVEKLTERERRASTGMDNGLAIPHASIVGMDNMMLCVARSQNGIPFGAMDNLPSHLFFTLFYPAHHTTFHSLKTIGFICRIVRSPSVLKEIMEASTASEILNIIQKQESRMKS